MKNIDKIQKMSAEELARKLDEKGRCGFCVRNCVRNCDGGCLNCEDNIIRWLNQEVNPLPSFEIADVIETVYNRYAVIWENTVIGVKGTHRTTIPAYICPVDDVLAHETVKTIWRYNQKKKLYKKIWGADNEN